MRKSIGDLWLGIDGKSSTIKTGPKLNGTPGKEQGPLNVEITLEIDETTLSRRRLP